MSASESRFEPPFGCAEFDDALPDYLEGELPPAERLAMDAHVVQCAACAESLRGLQAIVAGAHALPMLSPSRDLWPEVERRIDVSMTALSVPAVRVASTRMSRTISLRQFAAAAVLLVLASSGATYLLARFPSTASPSTHAVTVEANAVATTSAPSIIGVAPRPVLGTHGDDPMGSRDADSTSSVATRRDARVASYQTGNADVIYEREINAMRTVVDQRLTELDAHTIAEIKRNLRIIDQAIADSRTALARDPRSQFLGAQLDRALETKLSTLRMVALL